MELMPAVDELPAFAQTNGWVVEAREPDFFGDQRFVLFSGFGDEMMLVFADTGALAGAYLSARDRTNWHTEKVGVARNWIIEGSGEYGDE